MKLLALLGLALVSTTSASTITVGPSGTFATIQAGINAAIAAGGSNEVRIQAGSYTENFSVTQASGALNITGGWNAAFTLRNFDPTATLISGGATARVLTGTFSGGTFTLDGVLIAAGVTTSFGGGARFYLSGTALANVRHTNFVLNAANPPTGAAQGGALYAYVAEGAALILDNDRFDSNGATSSGNAANGAGIFVDIYNAANVAISNSLFQNNVATTNGATGSANGGGAALVLHDAAQLSFFNNVVYANRLQAPTGYASGVYVGMACAACQIGLNTDVFDSNQGGSDGQLSVLDTLAGGTSALRLSELLLARGDHNGAYINVSGGTVHLINLTAADNAGTGLDCFDNIPFTLFNSLAFNNGTNVILGNSSSQGNNLIGVDPLFVDAAHANYHVKFNSPARDAGTATPPGGLGLFDLDGNPRNFGVAPDIGAYEIGDKIFKDGFQ